MIRRSELAFRTQLVIPEHEQLYDYWVERAGERPMPSRGDLHPGHIPKLLPLVSLIDVERAPARYRFRLVGTRLFDIYGRDLTGAYVDEVDWGQKQDYWAAAYRRVVEGRRPAQGVVKKPHRNKDHMVQFWLRLPLSEDGERVTMILSYDTFVPFTKALRLADMREDREPIPVHA